VRVPSLSKTRSMRRRLLAWYSAHGRSFPWRLEGVPVYEQVIAELLLQRTRADVVAEHLPRILKIVPSWRALAAAPLATLEGALKPLGLWQRRASSLKRLGVEVMAAGGDLPQTRSALESLPGVGQYMANAFTVILGLGRAPYIDVNMARVLERNFGPRRLSDIRYDYELQVTARRLTNSPLGQRVNWAVLDLAALVCKPRVPDCGLCPLRRTCLYGRRVSRS
jgi:A/G-specific adenine glycosylase